MPKDWCPDSADECCGCAGRALSASVQAERYLWSVTPCLMAWPAVILEPGPGSLIVGTTLGVSALHSGCIPLPSKTDVVPFTAAGSFRGMQRSFLGCNSGKAALSQFRFTSSSKETHWMHGSLCGRR